MTTVQIPEPFAPLFQPYRYKASYGGRGGAKSHAFASALVIQGAQRPLRILCCREVQRSIRDSVKRLLDDKIEAHGLTKFYESIDTEIRGRNGTLFVFAGLRTNPDSIKSMEGLDRAWIEEANSVSQRSLELLVPTLRKPSSEIWASWNPRFPDDPIDDMFRGNGEKSIERRKGKPFEPPPRSVIIPINYDQNPWFPDVLREEMEWDRRRDPEKYLHIWQGEYQRNSEARVFRNWRVGAHDEFKRPERWYFGADWGFSVDPTVLIRCYVEGRTLFVDKEAHKIGCSIDHTPALFDRLDEAEPKMARTWKITADSARPETIDYMRRNGYPKIMPARKGAGSVEDGIEFLKNHDIVVHPDCRHTIDELTMYSWKTDKQTGEILPVLEDKENHVIDALRYAVESLRGYSYDINALI